VHDVVPAARSVVAVERAEVVVFPKKSCTIDEPGIVGIRIGSSGAVCE
jgi:hypothetical protein